MNEKQITISLKFNAAKSRLDQHSQPTKTTLADLKDQLDAGIVTPQHSKENGGE